jgi:acetolactate synthase-1/2/3 large subunit
MPYIRKRCRVEVIDRADKFGLVRREKKMKMRVATAIAKFLESAGTEYLFGYCGHGNWALLDAFTYETKIKGIACRSEDQAVHMADGYWRMKRQPPMALVSTSVGPGNTNITSAIANAFFESSALMVLAGAGSTQWADRGGIEEFYRFAPDEWVLSLKPLVKKAVVVNRPDTALDMVMRAYKTAVTGRPGPVVVQIPFDIQHTEIEIAALPDPQSWLCVSPVGPDPTAIERAAGLIAQAERPLVVVGSGVHNARAWDELQAFAEDFQLPVEMTSTGKGSLPEDHALSLGSVGRAGTGHGNQAAQACDVLVGIGTHFSDIDTGGWTLHQIPKETKLIHIDVDSSEIARVYATEVGIVSDARLALTALSAALKKRKIKDHQPWLSQIAEWKKRWEEQVAPIIHSEASPLHYGRIMTDASQVIQEIDPQASILFDTGHCLSFGPPFLKTNSRYVAHCGFYHRMGWSLPCGLGAKLARPDHASVVFMGDGSFLMTGTTLATAVEYDIPLVVVVFDNCTLQIERELMKRVYGRTAFCDYRLQATGELWNPDLVKWADAMGAVARRISRPEEIRPVVREALASKRPFVIDAAMDLEEAGYRSVWYPYPRDFADKVPGQA